MSVSGSYRLIGPEDLQWRESNLMKISNADFLERTGSEKLGARLWRLPPGSANTLHRHIRQEEFYFVLEGTGRIRVESRESTVDRLRESGAAVPGGKSVESEKMMMKMASARRSNEEEEQRSKLDGGTRTKRDGGGREIEWETFTVPKHGGVWVAPELLRQVFNDTAEDVLWLIVGGPEELELLPRPGEPPPDLSMIYPMDPKSLPKELEGKQWPPV